ncbi:MAG: KpsF/GutQ family sugar-phosphate isomerase, partial [Phycisphaerales bacterium]|nr:KpsF/GutQ family sugar-phosphate isomerase [Phycisphaerales bacterium]
MTEIAGKSVNLNEAVRVGASVIAEEADALRALAGSLGAAFADCLQTMLGADQIVVSGIGKSGNIAQKIAASMTSTGTPAVFMHPVEALHGDLGIVTPRHCLLALSRSGSTEEIVRFVAHFRRLGGPVIGMTQGGNSRLAELSTNTLLLPEAPEAGPLNLAPTTSCVQMLAAGDALAMALLHARGFQAEDFAQYHPEGALGRRLLLRAGDLMHTGAELPLANADATFGALLVEMTGKRLGLALVIDDDRHLVGVFTDGDLRRLFDRVNNPRDLTAREAITNSRRDPSAPAVPTSSVTRQRLAIDCLRIMEDSQITSLVVVDEDRRPIGVLRLLDILQAGV